MKSNSANAIERLRRIEGQVRGVQRMIEEERYCVDILTQTMAARAALRAVETLVLEDHADACLEAAIRKQDPDDQREKFRELIAIIKKFGS